MTLLLTLPSPGVVDTSVSGPVSNLGRLGLLGTLGACY